MASEEVGKALVALKETAIRERVRSGDLEALGDLELTTEEQELVQAAARDEWDSKAGFAATSGTFEALAYLGASGVSHETADQLDEALGLGLGWTGTAELGKCEKCKKWDALFLDAASLTATSGASEIWDPSRLSQDPAAAQDPGRFGV